MFRGVVEVTHYTQQGFDSYADTSLDHVLGVSVEDCEKRANALIKLLKDSNRTGDFGISLSSYSAKLLSIEEFTVVKEFK
jgi:hypothetical protein